MMHVVGPPLDAPSGHEFDNAPLILLTWRQSEVCCATLIGETCRLWRQGSPLLAGVTVRAVLEVQAGDG